MVGPLRPSIGFGSVGGFTYLIREWVPGRPVLVAGCTPAVLDQVLSAVATQAGLAPGGTQDWSSYVLRVLFSDDWDGLSPLRDTTPATAELLAVCRRIAATTSSRRLPRGDFVHGDFNFANILVRDDGGIAILDMEQAGRGTRAYDLATLFMVTRWPGEELDEDLQNRVRRAGEEVAGEAVFRLCLLSIVLDWTRFGTSHWPESHVEQFSHRWGAFPRACLLGLRTVREGSLNGRLLTVVAVDSVTPTRARAHGLA